MFCVDYFPYKKGIETADQFKIKYNPKDTSLRAFLKKWQWDKTIIIDVTQGLNNADLLLFSQFKEKYGNFKLIVRMDDERVLQKLREKGIPYFFSKYFTTIDEVYEAILLQPSDMYICEELGFSLDRISKLLHSHNIKVRVFPNICQSSANKIPPIKKFFIRPEDIPLYEQFVDVFELVADQQRVQIIYKIYNDHKWLGNLKDIIPTFADELNNKHILNIFGPVRLKCGKRCMYDPSSCSLCSMFILFADALKDKNLEIREQKNVTIDESPVSDNYEEYEDEDDDDYIEFADDDEEEEDDEYEEEDADDQYEEQED